MRAAIYARKSSLTGDAEDVRSTTRQLEDCRTFCADRQWQVVAEFVEREGTSGGTFDRPEFVRMLSAAESEACDFDRIVTWDVSRFTRADPLDALEVTRRFARAGVTVMLASTGQAMDVVTPTGGLVTHVNVIGTSQFREAIRDAVRAQKKKAAREGYATSCVPLGYGLEGERKRKKIVIDPEAAAIVSGIFSKYAAGWSIAQIVTDLNKRKVANPRARSGATGWTWTTVRQVLTRETYRGLVITGRYAKLEGSALPRAKRKTIDGRTRSKARVVLPREQWHVRQAPELKIVDDATLAIVDARLASRDAGTHGRGSWKRRRVPLLTGGLLRCATCGRPFETANAIKPWGSYICSSRRRKHACTNTTVLRIDDMDRVVLDQVEGVLLSEGAVERLLARACAAPEQERRRLTDEIDRLQREIANLVKTAAAGAPPEITGPAMAERQADLQRAQERLRREPREQPDREALRRALTRQAGDWRRVLRGNPVAARALITRVLDQPIVVPEWPADLPAHIQEGIKRWTAQARAEALGEGVLPQTPSPV